MFTLESLPEDVKEKVRNLEFYDDNKFCLVVLKSNYRFKYDNSSIEIVESKEEVIELIRHCIKQKEEEQ